GHRRDPMQRLGDAALVVERAKQRQALLEAFLRLGAVALVDRDPTGTVERLRPDDLPDRFPLAVGGYPLGHRLGGSAVESEPQPSHGLRTVRADMPEPPDRGAEPKRMGKEAALQVPGDGRPQVDVLGIELVKPVLLVLAGQVRRGRLYAAEVIVR